MKKVFLSIVALAALVAIPMSVSAQNTATTNTTSHVRILSPISIVNDNTLEFGVVARTAGATGSITVLGAENATRSVSGSGVVAVNTAAYTVTPGPAKFTVSGNGGSAYSILINNGTHTAISLGTGLTLDLFGATEATAVPSAGTISGTLGNNGEYTPGNSTFYFGGKLTIAANAVAGDYTSANIPVVVAYN